MMRRRYGQLPVSAKLLLPILLTFLSLWTVGTISFGIFASNRLEQSAQKELEDAAAFLEHDLNQRQLLLHSKAQSISMDSDVVKAMASGDRDFLLRTMLPLQTSFELDLVTIVDPQGQVEFSLQTGSLRQASLQDASIHLAAQAALNVSGVLLAENTDPASLVSSMPIKSTQQVLGGLVVGRAVDDSLLHQIRSDTSMHLIAFEGNQITASTLPINRNQAWQFPAINRLAWRRIGDADYLIKTFELSSFDQATLKVAVLSLAEESEQTETQLWILTIGFGLLGAALVSGVTIGGFRTTQALSQRIQRLTRATQQLAEGDLTLRLPVNNQDEVGLLSEGFNRMAEQLTVRDQQLNQQMQQLESTLEELHRTQSQMVQSEKMSALGQMVAGVAHEINNPVNFIYANLPYLEEHTQDLRRLLNAYQHHYPQPSQSLQAELDQVDLEFLNEDLAKILQSMNIGSERIRDIVVSLRNFSRLDEAEFKPVDLHEGLDNSLMILQHRFKANPGDVTVEVVKNYGQLPLVECYPGQLNQVFMNLLANAIDALENSVQSGRIWISTQVTADQQVQIVVADNGMGISEAVQSRIFDPFFTTKSVGKGTGLGLSISHQIITEKHHGKMWCDSRLGSGTKFVVEIPIHAPNSQT